MPSVARLIVQSLEEAGAPRLFGVPGGGSSLELLEAARAQGLPFVLAHQETAACIMAAVSGELTGRPGAVLATLGPGAASAVNGLAYASLDRAPIIFITDRHPKAALAFTTHQSLDHAALVAAVCKTSLLLAPDSAHEVITRAIHLSLEEPRGPVHLDLPSDVAGQTAPAAAVNLDRARSPHPDARLLDEAAELMKAAHRPVLIAGLECRGLEEAKRLSPGGIFPHAGPHHLQGLMMVAAELETVRRLGLPIVVVVFDDAGLSLIRAKQIQRGYDETPMKYAGPDLEAMAQSFGLASFRAENDRELHEAFAQALARQEPALVDARIDRSAYPQVLEAIRGEARKESL